MASFKVKVTNRKIIKASNPCHDNQHILPVSNLDLIPARDPAALIHIYPKQHTTNNVNSLIATINSYLPTFLNHFYPFAGRIAKNPVTGRPEILCNNEGAELVQAHADICLFDIDFSVITKSLDMIIIPFAFEIPLCLQVVRFSCGGFAITWCSNHLLVDAFSLSKFSSSWRELVLTGKISGAPNFDRSLFLPRSPKRFNPTVDGCYTTCTPNDWVNVLSGTLLTRGIYLVTASDINRLQAMASQDGCRATKLEAFSAHIWKVLAEIVGEADTACKMGWFVDGRRRIGSAHAVALENYIGNGHSAVIKEANIRDLKAKSLSQVVKMVTDAIKQVANEDHFLDLVNWVQCHEKEFMLLKGSTGLGSPAIFISSCHHLAMESEFGFGKALLGLFHALGSERYASGFMNLSSSAQGDGSWIVDAVLWPQAAMVLQSNPVCALRPVTANYLREMVKGEGDQGSHSRL